MYPNLASNVPMVIGVGDGPTITSSGAVTCIPAASKMTLPNGYWTVGKKWKLKLAGRISCANPTPGTATFDLRTGPSGTIIAYNTGAISLNVAGKTNVPFMLEVDLVCRAVGTGTTTTLFGIGKFTSEAVVGAAVPTVGGNGVLMVPVGAPAVGTGFDNTAANTVDVFYNHSLSTASMTVHQYEIEEQI